MLYALLDITHWAYTMQTHCTYSSYILYVYSECVLHQKNKSQQTEDQHEFISEAYLKCKCKILAFKSVFPRCSSILRWKLCQANCALTWLISWGCTLYGVLPRLAIFTHCQVEVIVCGMTCVCTCMGVQQYVPMYTAVQRSVGWCFLFISWLEKVNLGHNLFTYVSVVWIMYAVGIWWLLTGFTLLSLRM